MASDDDFESETEFCSICYEDSLHDTLPCIVQLKPRSIDELRNMLKLLKEAEEKEAHQHGFFLIHIPNDSLLETPSYKLPRPVDES